MAKFRITKIETTIVEVDEVTGYDEALAEGQGYRMSQSNNTSIVYQVEKIAESV